MILTAHQPAYLPWLGYFHKIAMADVFVVLDTVQFEKNGYINRNKIKTSNGESWLTVPVSLKGHTSNTIRDTLIQDIPAWRKKQWSTILLNYKKTPFFYKYVDFFEHYFTLNINSLVDFIEISFGFLIKELEIHTPIKKLSEFDLQGKKSDLIVELCAALECDSFIFGKAGASYVDTKLFSEKKIAYTFQNYLHPTYTQIWGQFIPNLSVIDALFNIGPERTRQKIFDGNDGRADIEKYLMTSRFKSRTRINQCEV